MTQQTGARVFTDTWVWKIEYDATLAKNLLLESRYGGMLLNFDKSGYSTEPRIEDLGNNFVSGGYLLLHAVVRSATGLGVVELFQVRVGG